VLAVTGMIIVLTVSNPLKGSGEWEDEPESLDLNPGLRRTTAGRITKLNTNTFEQSDHPWPLGTITLSNYNSLIAHAFKHPLQLILNPEFKLQEG